MTGRIFAQEENFSSNGGVGYKDVCIDGKVHLRISRGWYDQTGDEYNAYDSHSTEVIGVCDGICHQTVELNDQQQKLVEEFLATGQKGKLGGTTKRYPDAIPGEDGEPMFDD